MRPETRLVHGGRSEPASELRDERVMHGGRRRRLRRIDVDAHVLGRREQQLESAATASVARGLCQAAPDQLLEVEPSAAEPDLEPAGELRGGERLTPEQFEHADPGGMRECTHRLDAAQAKGGRGGFGHPRKDTMVLVACQDELPFLGMSEV